MYGLEALQRIYYIAGSLHHVYLKFKHTTGVYLLITFTPNLSFIGGVTAWLTNSYALYVCTESKHECQA